MTFHFDQIKTKQSPEINYVFTSLSAKLREKGILESDPGGGGGEELKSLRALI